MSRPFHLCCQILFTASWQKSLAAIGELIKTAATIRSTRTVRFMHEACFCDAEADWTS